MKAELQAELIMWLRGKIVEARRTLKAREQAEACFRIGTDAEWASAAKLHPSTADRPTMKKAARLNAAARERRIAEKCRHDLAMLKAALAMVISTPTKPSL